MVSKVLIMGLSGTGKSTSLMHMDPEKCAVVNPVGKPLPFKGGNKFTTLDSVTDSKRICEWMKEQAALGKKVIVVDDFQYFLSIPFMNRIHENGWDKWNDFGADYYSIIEVCDELPKDVRVYFLTHCETLDDGTVTIKLIGKLLREKISIEGLFTIVLRTSVIDGKYYFLTQNSGRDTVKSPIGMFPDYAVENNLAYIDDKICNYYEIGNYKSDEEMAEADKAAGDDTIAKPTAGRRARNTEPKKERKSRAQVQEENDKKIEEYVKAEEEALESVANGREEVPFEELPEVEAPALEKLPRETREEKEARESAEKGAFSGMNPPEKQPRGRKAREIEAQGNPAEIEETKEPEATEKPARSRRRRS